METSRKRVAEKSADEPDSQRQPAAEEGEIARSPNSDIDDDIVFVCSKDAPKTKLAAFATDESDEEEDAVGLNAADVKFENYLNRLKEKQRQCQTLIKEIMMENQEQRDEEAEEIVDLVLKHGDKHFKHFLEKLRHQHIYYKKLLEKTRADIKKKEEADLDLTCYDPMPSSSNDSSK